MIARALSSSTGASLVELVDRAALAALHDELAAYPKPGLVSFVDSGAHADMDAGTFLASLGALRGFFGELAGAARDGAPVASLRAFGLAAEARMLSATGGVNTHRGAIFALGLLAAAAGRVERSGAVRCVATLRAELRRLGVAVARELPVSAGSHGSAAARDHGVSGARGEGSGGLPHVFDVALPALERSLARGACARAAAVQALLELIAVVPDTNLLHRGGARGLAFARAAARGFLARGGVHEAGWEERALALHRAFVARELSPGGSADLLAAALFASRLCPPRARAAA